MSRLWGRAGTGVKEKPPLREVLWGAVKCSSPLHAEKCSILPILSVQGRYFFHGGSLEVAVAAVECVDEAEVPCRVSVPTLQKSRMQFDWEKFQQSLKTLQFQRSKFKV